MNKAQQKRFDSLYRKHLSALKRQGKADSTIDLYSCAIRRVCEYFDSPPDTLTQEQLEGYFESLISTHSWSTVKVDRNGLQFFYKHVLKRDWQWVDIVKPPQEKHLPRVPQDHRTVHPAIHLYAKRYRSAHQWPAGQAARGMGGVA